MKATKQTVTITSDEYINLRSKVNALQSENYLLRTVVDSITVALKNSGMVEK